MRTELWYQTTKLEIQKKLLQNFVTHGTISITHIVSD